MCVHVHVYVFAWQIIAHICLTVLAAKGLKYTHISILRKISNDNFHNKNSSVKKLPKPGNKCNGSSPLLFAQTEVDSG